MTNREEDLKKINAELEKLSDDELDEVAGGTMEQVHSDIAFFQSLGVDLPDPQEFKRSSRVIRVAEMAWKSVGIHCLASRHDDNEYFFNGERITLDEAKDRAIKVLKGEK